MKNVVVAVYMSEQQRDDLKLIVRGLGFRTVSEWLRSFVREKKVLTNKVNSV